MERISDEFWALVDKPAEGCWNWQGGLMGTGYGWVKVRGKLTLCHRYVWWALHGEWPEVVMHLCDNRRCLRPDHLRGGTQRENVADAVSKGRHAKGSDYARSKLSEESAVALRNGYVAGTSYRLLAEQFGVARSTVSRVVTRKIWKHV